MKRWNIRIRLTLLFAGLQTVLVFVFSGSIYWFFGRGLIDAFDRNLSDKAEALAAAYEVEDGKVEVEFADHHRTGLWQDTFAEIRTGRGELVYRHHSGQEQTIPSPLSGTTAAGPTRRIFSVFIPGRGDYRCIRLTDSRYGRPFVITVAGPLKLIHNEQRQLLRVILPTGAAVVVLSSVLGWLIIGGLLQPLGQIALKARKITAQRLDQRLEVRNPQDEIGRLATTLNGMIERLQASFNQMRRFTSDASHELRTPLTAIRSEVEVALNQSRQEEEYREVLGSILEEIERLTKLSDTLLTLARLDGGDVNLQLEPVDLGAVLQEAADGIRVQAQAKGASFHVERGPDPCVVHGDRQLLKTGSFELA